MDNFNKLITALIFVALCTSVVSAFGVNSPYWQGNPLKMYPGESREASFNLVNGVNEGTAEATVVLIRGAEVAEITGETDFTLPPGSNTENIVLTLTIPADAQLGQTYQVEFSVRDNPSEEEGNVQLNVGYNVNFPVEVVSQEFSSSLTEAPTSAGSDTQGEENGPGFGSLSNQGGENGENGPCADGSYNCGGGIIRHPATIPIAAIIVVIAALVVLIVFARKNKTVK